MPLRLCDLTCSLHVRAGSYALPLFWLSKHLILQHLWQQQCHCKRVSACLTALPGFDLTVWSLAHLLIQVDRCGKVSDRLFGNRLSGSSCHSVSCTGGCPIAWWSQLQVRVESAASEAGAKQGVIVCCRKSQVAHWQWS